MYSGSIMRRHHPPYHGSPRRGYGGRRISPPRSGYGGHSGCKEQNDRTLHNKNLPLDSKPNDRHTPLEKFGPITDLYTPKNHHIGEIIVTIAKRYKERHEKMRHKARLRMNVIDRSRYRSMSRACSRHYSCLG